MTALERIACRIPRIWYHTARRTAILVGVMAAVVAALALSVSIIVMSIRYFGNPLPALSVAALVVIGWLCWLVSDHIEDGRERTRYALGIFLNVIGIAVGIVAGVALLIASIWASNAYLGTPLVAMFLLLLALVIGLGYNLARADVEKEQKEQARVLDQLSKDFGE